MFIGIFCYMFIHCLFQLFKGEKISMRLFTMKNVLIITYFNIIIRFLSIIPMISTIFISVFEDGDETPIENTFNHCCYNKTITDDKKCDFINDDEYVCYSYKSFSSHISIYKTLLIIFPLILIIFSAIPNVYIIYTSFYTI